MLPCINMSDKPFRWRTIIEVAIISIGLYVFLGAPGLRSARQTDTQSREQDVPVAQARAESLVYPDVKNLQCSQHDYHVHIFSTDPLVVYIDGFLSDREAKHLVEIRYARHGNGTDHDSDEMQLWQMAEVYRLQRWG